MAGRRLLKAGAASLVLVAASTVFFLGPEAQPHREVRELQLAMDKVASKVEMAAGRKITDLSVP